MRFIILLILALNGLSLYAQFGATIITDSVGDPGLLFDLDNDGDLDIIVSSNVQHIKSTSDSWNENRISWFENNNGKFTEQTQITSDTGEVKFILADFDNDGWIDVIASRIYRGIFYSPGDSAEIIWFQNNGDKTFSAEKPIFNQFLNHTQKINDISILVEDFNNDGFNDLITSTSIFSNPSLDKQYHLVGSSNLTFTLNQNSNSIGFVIYMDAIDFDKDGWKDLVVNKYNNYFVLRNIGGSISTQGFVIHQYDPGGSIEFHWLEDNSTDTHQWVFQRNDTIFLTTHKSNFVFESKPLLLDIPPYSLREAFLFNPYEVGIVFQSTDSIFVIQTELDSSINIKKQLVAKLTSARYSPSLITSDLDQDGDVDIINVRGIQGKWTLYENFIESPYFYQGITFIDSNLNHQYDSTEPSISFVKIHLDANGAAAYSFDGIFKVSTNSGKHTISYKPINNWRLNSDSTSYTRELSQSNPTISNLNFGFVPDTIITQVSSSIFGSFPRCNQTSNYWINLKNEGTTLTNSSITLTLDDSITFISSDISPSSINGNSISWQIDSLYFLQAVQIRIQVQMPDYRSIGKKLTSNVEVISKDIRNSVLPDTSSSVLYQNLRCAYDPNDKTAFIHGIEADTTIPKNSNLEYLIRFQNTGNDTAINVVVRDQLDSNLDWQSFEIIGTSHEAELRLEKSGELVFDFQNIFLVDSNTNEPESHGFIRYRIKTKNNLNPNSTISNTADIYFDFNPAIVTNTVQNYIECYDTSYMPLIRQINGVTLEVDIENAKSFQWFKNDSILVGETNKRLTISDSGRYKAYVQDSLGCFHFSKENHFFTNGLKQSIFLKASLSPNPFNNELTITFDKTISKNLTIEIFDIKGRLIRLGKAYVNRKHILFKENLTPGLYILKIQDDEQVLLNQKVLVE